MLLAFQSFATIPLRHIHTMNHSTELLSHPVVQHHLTQLREKHTAPSEFRAIVKRLAYALALAATADFPLSPHTIETPLTAHEGSQLAPRVGLAPILRAGLGMVEPVLEMLPQSEVWHLGMYRDEATAQPVTYYNKLPAQQPVDIALVLDPMLATGGSAVAAITELRSWGVVDVRLLSIIASAEGIRRVEQDSPGTRIYVCAIDPILNEQKFIVPGLGDAGDRIFGTLG